MSRGDNCIGTRGTPTWILQFYLSIIKQSCHDSILFSLGTSINICICWWEESGGLGLFTPKISDQQMFALSSSDTFQFLPVFLSGQLCYSRRESFHISVEVPSYNKKFLSSRDPRLQLLTMTGLYITRGKSWSYQPGDGMY